MRYAIAFLLVLLGGSFLALPLDAQALTLAQADSLRFLLRTNKADTNRVGMLLRLSDYCQSRTLNHHHNLDTAMTLAVQAETLSQQLRYDKGQQDARFQQGRVFIKQEKLSQLKRMFPTVDAITRIRLLLELGKNKLRPTYSQEAKLDSALLLFSQAQRFSERLGSQLWQQESQMLTGVAYLFKGDCKRSQASFMRVIQARQRAGDLAGELRARLRWAVTQHSEFKYCDHADSLNRAFALARQLGDRPRETLLQLLVGYQHAVKGNLAQAKDDALKALAIQKAIGYPTLNRADHALLEENRYLTPVQLVNLSNAYNLLADIYSLTDNTNQTVLYTLEVIKDVERSGLWEELDWFYFGMGNIYYDLKEYAKALPYYQQSLAISHQKGLAVIHIGMIRHMIEPLLKGGNTRQALQLLTDFTSQHLPLKYQDRVSIACGFGQCYAALKQNKLAETYYLESIAWGKKEGEIMEYFTWRYISEFYVATAQYAKAAPYLKRLGAYRGMFPFDLIEKMNLNHLQFKVDSAQGNYASALHHHQRYTALKDSLFNETTSKQIAELDIKYQTTQKEQTLKLRQKDIILLTQRGETQKTQRNALIGGTLLLAGLLGLGFNRYRLKQRSNQLLQAQQEQIYHKNEELQRLLDEKELLLREIHHRVKNNLQIVMSLLNSQAASLRDPTALSAIQQSQHRVQAMALIHQKLYQAQGVARIPMAAYIQEVVSYLHESYELPQPICFELHVEPIELDVTQAVPLGLIINEAITNALKYAFPDGRKGTVRVGLGERSCGAYELVIADDGVGLPADFDPARSRSLGITLIHGFSEQLGGQLQINGRTGLAIRLQFRDELYTAYS